MSQQSSMNLNLAQNHPDFELKPLNEQPPLFKGGYLEKILDPIQENPEDIRTCTIKCLVRGCSKKWPNQRIYAPTSNYYTHFRSSHKFVNLKALKEGENNSESEASSQVSQPTINSLFNKQSGQREESFTINHFKRLLLSFIINNNISFRAVTTPSFKSLLNYLNYQTPPLYRQTLMDELNLSYIEKSLNIKEELQENIKSQGTFSITLDAWTAINQKAFLGITLHFINKDFKLKSYLLAMKDLNDIHSGVYMLSVLLDALKQYNIEYNITSITRDNASSNDTLLKAFIKYYNKEGIKFQGDIPCIAHVLNLVIQDILKALIKNDYDTSYSTDLYEQEMEELEDREEEEVEQVTNLSIWRKVRKTIIGLKYNQENRRLLEAQIKAFNIENARFPQLDQKTRWSSTYYMLKNFLHIYEAIKVVINSSNSKAFKNKSLVLTNIEITYLNNILNIISIFVKATTKLQAENYPTIYYIIPEVYKIYNRLETFKREFKDKAFTDAIDKGIAKLRKYYPKTGVLDNKSKALYLALILDPRIKQEGLNNIGLSTGISSDIYNRLKTDYNVYKYDYNLSQAKSDSSDISMADSDSDDLDIYITNSSSKIDDELITYLEEKREDKKTKPLDYWKSNAARFPILALIARKYLGIPASSAASERFFSQGALIMSKLRNRLNKSTFEMISCLKSWGLFKDELEEIKKEEEKGKKRDSEEDNQFIIIEN